MLYYVRDHRQETAWDYIRDVWLPQSRYERRHDYEFERYVEESRLFSETIFVPIRIKKD